MMRLLTCAAIFALAGCQQERPLNVWLVTMDTTRVDHIGAYGHDGIQTPSIDRMAAEGVRYDFAYSPVPITLPAHTSMMTGTYPIFHGVRENGGFYVPQDLTTLAELLSEAGYDTAAFVGAFPLDSQTGIDQGFDVYDDHYPSSLESGKHPMLRRFFDERPAEDVQKAATLWLGDSPRRAPFFMWTHYFDPHQPLTPPKRLAEQYPHSAYDAEIAAVDEAIGAIIQHLESIEEMADTLVIITADHGEGLGEHGESTHALLLYSSTLHVPLIVRDPRQHPGVVNAPVTTVDIFPTVLDRLGMPVPEMTQGQTLPHNENEADRERMIYSETMFGRLIYGWSPLERITLGTDVLIRGPGDRRHYDRANDLPELIDLANGGQTTADLERGLEDERALLAWEGRRFSRGEDIDTNAEELKAALARLESLGYVGSGSSADVSDDAIDPDRPNPLEMMEVFNLHNEGGSLIDAGRADLAAAVLQRARSLDPTNPAALQSLAQAHIARGDKDNARHVLTDLLALQEGDVRTLLVLARFHRDQNEFDEAIALLRTAVAKDPNDTSSRLILAHLLEDQGSPADAIVAYRDLLEVDPAHTLGMNGLATLLYGSGEVEEAGQLLEQVLAQQPFFAPAWLNLAVVESDRDPARASQLIERALALRPGYPQALELRNRLKSGEE